MSRELDALVAEKVMGWTNAHRTRPGACLRGYPPTSATITLVPAYSSEIAAAWAVVERMREQGYAVTVRSASEGRWVARTWKAPDDPSTDWVREDSAPLAIVLAALRAVGVPEDEIQKAVAA